MSKLKMCKGDNKGEPLGLPEKGNKWAGTWGDGDNRGYTSRACALRKWACTNRAGGGTWAGEGARAGKGRQGGGGTQAGEGAQAGGGTQAGRGTGGGGVVGAGRGTFG